MINKLVLLAAVLFSFQGLAQDDEALSAKKANYQVNDNYKSGNFLIYNCESGYYSCVDQDGYTKCQEKRQLAMDKKKKTYPCAPLKKFQNKKLCGQKNYEVVESLAMKRFCYPKN